MNNTNSYTHVLRVTSGLAGKYRGLEIPPREISPEVGNTGKYWEIRLCVFHTRFMHCYHSISALTVSSLPGTHQVASLATTAVFCFFNVVVFCFFIWCNLVIKLDLRARISLTPVAVDLALL